MVATGAVDDLEGADFFTSRRMPRKTWRGGVLADDITIGVAVLCAVGEVCGCGSDDEREKKLFFSVDLVGFLQ